MIKSNPALVVKLLSPSLLQDFVQPQHFFWRKERRNKAHIAILHGLCNGGLLSHSISVAPGNLMVAGR